MKPKEMLIEFDEYLAVRKLQFEAIVIGGAALAILGVVSRETQDCDVLDPNIPLDIEKAAHEFSHEISKSVKRLYRASRTYGCDRMGEVSRRQSGLACSC